MSFLFPHLYSTTAPQTDLSLIEMFSFLFRFRFRFLANKFKKIVNTNFLIYGFAQSKAERRLRLHTTPNFFDWRSCVEVLQIIRFDVERVSKLSQDLFRREAATKFYIGEKGSRKLHSF